MFTFVRFWKGFDLENQEPTGVEETDDTPMGLSDTYVACAAAEAPLVALPPELRERLFQERTAHRAKATVYGVLSELRELRAVRGSE